MDEQREAADELAALDRDADDELREQEKDRAESVESESWLWHHLHD